MIDAEQVRSLAEKASVRILDEPAVSPAEALRYQPSAAVERWVRMRDMTCRFPGCDRSAVMCDVDHTIPFNHADPRNGGLTVPWNLKCLCRQHHRDKTFDEGWRDEQLPDGTVVWTSPTGQIYRDHSRRRRPVPRHGFVNCMSRTKTRSSQPLPGAGSPHRAHPLPQQGSAAHQRGAPPTATSTQPRDRPSQRPQSHAQNAVHPEGPTQHQPLLHMDQRRLRARRAAAGLAAPSRSTSAARRPTVLTPLGSVRDLLAWCRAKTPLMPHNQFADMTDVSRDGGKGVCA